MIKVGFRFNDSFYQCGIKVKFISGLSDKMIVFVYVNIGPEKNSFFSENQDIFGVMIGRHVGQMQNAFIVHVLVNIGISDIGGNNYKGDENSYNGSKK